MTVALGGDGGDELFAGYQTFRALPAARLYNAVVPKALHRFVVTPLADRLPTSNGYFSWDFKVRQFLRGMKVPPHQRLWRWLGAMTPEALPGLLTADVLREIQPRALFSQLKLSCHAPKVPTAAIAMSTTTTSRGRPFSVFHDIHTPTAASTNEVSSMPHHAAELT